ncbi:MAG: type II toxin-antitoxin system VapC family toxin, partial [bacterium]|nr:type II toxin-antitoxin system VapC family toxin [bacterium]
LNQALNGEIFVDVNFPFTFVDARDLADGMIAATALEHELTFVTRNVKDYDGLGVTIFNPWEAA